MIMTVQVVTAADPSAQVKLQAYDKFKMALKSKEVQRQYPNLLERFLDFAKSGGGLT